MTGSRISDVTVLFTVKGGRMSAKMLRAKAQRRKENLDVFAPLREQFSNLNHAPEI